MNIWRRERGPSRLVVFGPGERPDWVWDPLPGRLTVHGAWSPFRRFLNRIRVFLGWRPVLHDSLLRFPDEPDDDGLLGDRVPRRPMYPPGVLSTAADPPSSAPELDSR
jgi:hypothetical protein